MLDGQPGEQTVPMHREALPAGAVELAYTRTADGWVPPSVFIRLHNSADRKLFCVLLDLTDRFRMRADLFPGEHIAGRWTAAAAHGSPITLSLPPRRPIQPGASGTDWLMLLVAEEPFSADPFSLPRLCESSRGPSRGARRGITGILDRLGLLAVTRSDAPAPVAALDWTTQVTEIKTTVGSDSLPAES